MEKLVFLLVTIAHKLKPYLQAAGPHCGRPNRQASMKSNEQPRSRWTNGIMGN